MTDPDDNALTRPISVAELLAKNGTIGAPPVGGRRRRRRGNADAVTVAELTGEIPIITDDAPARTYREPAVREEPVAPVEPIAEEPAAEEPIAEPPEPEPEAAAAEVVEPEAEPAASDADVEPESETALTDEEADYAAHLAQRDADPSPLDFTPPPRRAQATKSSPFATQRSGAEQMSPDPLVDDDDEMLDLGPGVDFTEALEEPPATDEDVDSDEGVASEEELPSYLRSSSGTLFGGQSVADDLARRGPQPGPEDIDLDDDGHVGRTPVEQADVERADKPKQSTEQSGSAFVRGVWVVAQCVLAVAFGAGLFIAFDQLWRWNMIFALVLSVLVILGLVVGVRVVRKTEDIGSTLIAVAVGALVTLGPLALLQSH